jgi:surface carbohydrate biosynthesis protein
MNIYLHLEIILRELDSKLLLAVIAASRGNAVIISDMSSIMKGVKSGILKPGVFHTKSLSPGLKKMSDHQSLVDRGFSITSIDEEGGLIDFGYDKFAKVRYSEDTIKQASALFTWGPEDTETLKRVYPNYSSKIYQTGSPRADLWMHHFSEYWDKVSATPKKAYLLISSNLTLANNMRPFYESIMILKNGGYLQRDPMLFIDQFKVAAEEYNMTLAFIEAIRHLAESTKGFDIVLRPHPVENIEAWKAYLDDIPNVHVIREGSISGWVNNAFAVMHNSCTTALEATISGKPVITYLPFKQKYPREIPNELGVQVESLEDLTHTVNNLFSESVDSGKTSSQIPIPEIVSNKVYLDYAEFAAEKIMKVWEGFENGKSSKSSDWKKFKWLMKLYKARSMVGSILRGAFPDKFEPNTKNYKFPEFDEKDILSRVSHLKNVLGMNVELDCTLLSERAILIKKKL